MLLIASGIKNFCFALFTLVSTTGITWAFSYTIDTNPPGAIIINVVTKQKIGVTPVKVEIPDTQEGRTFGISYKDYRNVALMIYKPTPTPERAFTNNPPVVVTSALPGEYPLGVNIDESQDKVIVELRPVMSERVNVQ
ncbi:trhZ (plasmid) [Raoultella ornithinolytica]|uniref:trhZ n=1 Tax=Raoultella ornithinolytica TaxID=54291 RepID=UPI00084A1BCD|nr:trhZ [Raoultella ornithinolytica]AOO59954.1 trhZ [Raoultella ornithinolytica]